MEKPGVISRIFPIKYDFYKMLENQAAADSEAIDALALWLSGATEAEARLTACVARADEIRKDMEKKLVEAFSTPFDRGDIYNISIAMEKSLEYANSTLVSMKAFEVKPDDIIQGMASKLQSATATFSTSVNELKTAPEKAEQHIASIRAAHMDVEQLYRNGIHTVFNNGDPMEALRRREIYHHLKDSSKYLNNSVDVLHRIIVRLT